MTPEQIDRLPAGQALDVLIAEKMMDQKWRGGNPIANYGGKWPWPYPYSADIKAAWEVVEKMKPLRLWLIDLGDYHQASFLEEDSGEGVKANGETPMLAICRAALKAKLMEVKANV